MYMNTYIEQKLVLKTINGYIEEKMSNLNQFQGMFHFSMALYTKELDKTGSN